MGRINDAAIDAIPGWFYALDRDVFRVLLAASRSLGGDLAELGVYFRFQRGAHRFGPAAR